MKFLYNLNLKQSLFVDNSPFHLYENLDYGVPIIPFHGESDDKELLKLMIFLKGLQKQKHLSESVREHFNLSLYMTSETFEDFIESLNGN